MTAPVLRTTSVYTVRSEAATEQTLEAWRTAVRATEGALITESFRIQGQTVLRFRIAGGDAAALDVFHGLAQATSATLHTGVGVNQRQVN